MESPRRLLLGCLLMLMFTGCDQPAVVMPTPASLSDDAMGHYCGMQVNQHTGPKGHIFVQGVARPFWFSSVRDTLAFTYLPEEPRAITAIYVNDMGVADWDHPDDSSWIDGRQAWYVVGSSRTGGMGAAEIVPFAQRAKADAFVGHFGGQVLRLEQIPVESILGTAGNAAGGAG